MPPPDIFLVKMEQKILQCKEDLFWASKVLGLGLGYSEKWIMVIILTILGDGLAAITQGW